jgi:hypothetical protein
MGWKADNRGTERHPGTGSFMQPVPKPKPRPCGACSVVHGKGSPCKPKVARRSEQQRNR